MRNDKPKRILIIKLGAMGDVIHSTIIATAIKQKHPDWQVDFLTANFYAEIIKNHPHIDNIICWDRTQRKSFKYVLSIIAKLLKSRYDIIFNLTRATLNIIISLLAFPKKYQGKMNFETTWVEEYFLTAKNKIKDLELPERLYLGTDNPISEKVQKVFENRPRPYFVFSPGGDGDLNREGRTWELKKWAELSEKINLEFSGTIFVCGSPSEREKHLVLNSEIINVYSGDFSISEMNEFISQADIMISGDSGPLHVASAHNIKTLALLGSTSPDKIKPYGKNGYYISAKYKCLYCWNKKCKYLTVNRVQTPCMEALSVDEVFEKIKEIYNKSS